MAIHRSRQLAIFFSCLVLLLSFDVAMAERCIGTQKSKIFHNHPKACGSASRIQEDNQVVFKDASEARRAGRRQCRRCARLDSESKDDGAKDDDQPSQQPLGQPVRGGNLPPIRLMPPADANPAAKLLPQMVRIKRILPAGTLQLDNGDTVCFDGIIVPNEDQPHARDARDYIDLQTQGRLMQLAQDAHHGVIAGRDGLGRLRVRLAANDGGRDLAGELVHAGFAWVDRSRWTSRWDELSRLEENAWRGGRGIWQQLDGAAGKVSVVIGRDAVAYHERRCNHVKLLTDARDIELNEARARRLVPCEHFRASIIKRAQAKK